MNGKAVVAVVAAAGLLSGAAVAETRRVRRSEGRGAALADYVGLTPEQREQWKALRKEHDKEAQPLRLEGRELHEKLRAALEADKADATAVGKAMLALKDHREKVKASQEAFRARLRAQLSPEQAQKLEALEAARNFGRGERGGHRRTGRPGRPPMGEGFGAPDLGFGPGPGFDFDEELPPPIQG